MSFMISMYVCFCSAAAAAVPPSCIHRRQTQFIQQGTCAGVCGDEHARVEQARQPPASRAGVEHPKLATILTNVDLLFLLLQPSRTRNSNNIELTAAAAVWTWDIKGLHVNQPSNPNLLKWQGYQPAWPACCSRSRAPFV